MQSERLTANTYLTVHQAISNAESEVRGRLQLIENAKSISQDNFLTWMGRGTEAAHIIRLNIDRAKINSKHNRASSYMTYLEHSRFILGLIRALEIEEITGEQAEYV